MAPINSKYPATLVLWLTLLIWGGVQQAIAQEDTTKLRFPVSKTLPDNLQELGKKSPIDFTTPTNIRTVVVYDHENNRYLFQNKIGNQSIGLPFTMTPEEYMRYTLRTLNQDYFREKNSYVIQSSSPEKDKPLSLLNIRKSNNLLEEIFGEGGVQITTQGYIELSSGFNRTVTDNPTLPERARKRNIFEFDQNIQLNVNAKVGNKIDFGLNYNNDAMFDFDARRIRLAYQGDEDEIIKNIEAGNVSMTTSNSLISGGAALFGIKSDLQFGRLHISTVLSQQESESKTVSSSGGVQTTPFELTADRYDENRHFFLSHYFRDNYDRALEKLPFIQSEILITRVEAWITNKAGNYDQARNVLAFADMGEHDVIHNPMWTPSGALQVTHNEANTLYQQLLTTYNGVRDISLTGSVLPSQVEIGRDYEKVENARLLSANDYIFQSQLGYISLRTPLQPDEVLAVAFEFTYKGKAYQVGEFSNEIGRETGTQSGALFLKLLKPVSFSPQAYTWDLMMKNIYALGYGASNIQSDRFRLNITYQSDTTGVYLNYIPEGDIKEELLLRVMGLDNLNSKNDPYPDGVFDYVEGYTVMSQNGRIIFPVVEPFGNHLRKKIGNDAIADKYVYHELYDSTLTVARQVAEKNKFKIAGEYRGSGGSEINLQAMNVARGSVRVTAAGVELTEGIDYTVDYISGAVTIINQAIIDAGTPINVSLENQSMFNMQRKTMMGVNLSYDFSKDFTIGGTLMHYYEKPLIMKTTYGEESVRNTLWGLNTSFRKEFYSLTNLLDMLPFVEATAPSMLSANLEFAHLIPGHYKSKYTGAYAYLDDFETSTSKIDLRSPYEWNLAATPYNTTSSGLFPEAALTNNIDYGKNRAQLAWFYIDGLFTRRNSARTPTHIKNDREQLSNHLVREVYEREIFPNKQAVYGEPPTIPVFNLSYYPDERGPYNLDTEMDSDGKLMNPEERWGGITRKMDTRDFEAANIEYIEFWLMDPFVNDTTGMSKGGDLYFNLGEISEDVLKDGKKFFENGLPIDGNPDAVGYSVWGKYPLQQSTVYAFDNSQGSDARKIQDVGLNGLSTEEEKTFPAYADYLEELQLRLPGGTLAQMQEDKHSPINDPAGDNFRHYRGDEQDRLRLSILDRYKYYNGTEGNSLAPEEAQAYSTAARTLPDVEDIDADNTLNENETYYEYKVSLRPGRMQVGDNYIVDKREVSVPLRNGTTGKTTWYQFKIPIRDYQTKVGNIQGFNNIRFMRMFLTGYEQPVFLRFATLGLVRSEWRIYTRDVYSGGTITDLDKMDISVVNVEENSDRTPVNYVLPPGITRILDPSQPQLRQQNEQSMALKLKHLEPGDARAIYKNTIYDMRRYKRLQMFVHAEELLGDDTQLKDGEMSIFMRVGSDFRNNFYEYEIPLRLTPAGRYNTNLPTDQEAVWMPDNMFDFPLELFTHLKLKRNAAKEVESSINFMTPYSDVDPRKPGNRITVVGNPSLAEVKVMMIGIRNNTEHEKSAEVWINELRMSEFDEQGGWAAQGNVSLALSDIANIQVSGRKETAGFGALDQRLLERRNDDFSSINVALNIDFGRFLPHQAEVSAPFYYTYSRQANTPQYNPLDQDILLSDALKNLNSSAERDSLKNLTAMQTMNRSLSLSNVKVNVKSNSPMPYDPANLSFTYAYNEQHYRTPETEYDNNITHRLQANYVYTPLIAPWEPFKNIQSQSGWLKLIKSLNFNYLPDNVQLSTNFLRNYQEAQLRDLNAYVAGMTESPKHYLTFSSHFVWDRHFAINWNLTRNLKTSFRSGTIAEIEEPYLQVNRKLNREDYEVWRDSVAHSIRSFGKPLNYEQSADISYNLPFTQIPVLDWINSTVTYNSRYRWQRGAFIRDEDIGNVIQNDLSLMFNNRLNLVQFYNKIDYLRNVNQRFEGAGSIADDNNIAHTIAQYGLRAVMMLRSLNVNFGYRTRTDINGFSPMAGNAFGQLGSNNGLLPGLGFAFGFDGGVSFIERANREGWLVKNESNISPAVYNETKNLRIDGMLEPIQGLKINLDAVYEDNSRVEIRYMFEDMPKQFGGTFAMSTNILSSAFENSKSSNGYASAAFDRFVENRDIIAHRIKGSYSGTNYPNKGFIAETGHANQPFDPAVGDMNPNSADVLIPAFLAAYTGKSAENIKLTAFPSITSLLPNWDVTYDLLQAIPFLQREFRSFMIVHQYISQYRVGGYSSYLNWVSMNNDSDLGYIRDVLSGSPLPSSAYDIGAVSLTESFNPLIEARAVFNNNMLLSLRMNRNRTLNLNMNAYQIVETSDNDFVLGVGYRVNNFNRIIGFGSNTSRPKARRGSSRPAESEDTFNFGSEFSNDLDLRLDISHKTGHALIRKIDDGFTQPTSGLSTTSIRFSADYALSRALTLRAFFDKIINKPLVSSTSYATSNTNAGLSLRFNLNQ